MKRFARPVIKLLITLFVTAFLLALFSFSAGGTIASAARPRPTPTPSPTPPSSNGVNSQATNDLNPGGTFCLPAQQVAGVQVVIVNTVPIGSFYRVCMTNIHHDDEQKGKNMVTSEAAWSLKTNLRKLWADHVIWTREYLVAAIAATQDAQAAAGRLLKNQEHLGNAIIPYYGQAAGNKLTDLLKQHIMIAVDLVAAAKAGQQEQFQEHDQRWTQNAQDIATFLAGANPNWPAKDVADLLNLHLALTKKEAVARLTEKWEEDIAAFDDIFTEIMTVSDTLSEGIIKQFPDRF